ncbi:putative RZZ complex, subunit Zw10 protein [Plasmopara halstedii]
MKMLDTLTQKVNETHNEILLVQDQVVQALRSFYASSSRLSADAAAEIAAKWGPPHAFSTKVNGADASDLQDTMQRLNVAILDAVDRLQLDEAAEIAPEAQLMLSWMNREQLRKQLQQSQIMLMAIEQLITIDGLLHDVDEAINRKDFVTAAEGVVEGEKLVHDLLKEEVKEVDNVTDLKLIKVVELQLRSKKNRLLHELSKYFACTIKLKENMVKVMAEIEINEVETTRVSEEGRSSAYWKACKILNILAPRLKDLAKTLSQQMIKPMLQMPCGMLKQIRCEDGILLQAVPRDDACNDDEVAELQSKYANVVGVLHFVHAEVFEGNSELMNQFGDVLWKIPGNLEAQLLHILQEEIPQDFAAIEAFREVLTTAITGLDDTLVTLGFSACTDQLRGMVDQLNQLHSKKRRQVILGSGRDLIHRGYVNSVKVNNNSEKCNLTAPAYSRSKGKDDSKGNAETSTLFVNLAVEHVDSSCFQVPDYSVSVCAHEMVELAHQTILEACTASVSNANLLFQTARDLFLLFRSIVPTLYKVEIANNAQTCMLYHNDCLYMTYHMVVIGYLYKQRLRVPFNPTATMVDMIPSFRDAGEFALTSYTSAQVEEILSGLYLIQLLGAIDSESESKRAENFLKSTLYKLNTISSSWHEGMPLAVYNKVMSRMLEPLVKKIMEGILTQTNISEFTKVHLHHLLTLLRESELLFDSPAQANKYVPELEKLSKLTSLMMDPLTTVRYKFQRRSLDIFSPRELAALIRSLFRDSPEKTEFLQELKTMM